ncbi:DsrE family protein [Dyella mobilis]|uniref:DsrE family protein n=1 Tax=Dyella mobilis TaxID=1849582 RepID=A0ABS2KCS8_9GAMM|nr:DsrE family protein [Dyella mobilis]MBM7128986.1 DsrE family protein [Dyella mobilis]
MNEEILLAEHTGHADVSSGEPEFWTNPSISGYGKIHLLPRSAYQPPPDRVYHVVFAISAKSSEPGIVNPSLEQVARAVNLYVASGVTVEQLRFVAIAYGTATPITLNDLQHEAIFGMKNPNLPLIEELGDAGVDVAVCGQSVAIHNYGFDWIDGSVTIALSAVTTISSLQQKGYALVQS